MKKSETKSPKLPPKPPTKKTDGLAGIADAVFAAYATSFASAAIDGVRAGSEQMRAVAAKTKTERVKLAVEAFDKAAGVASISTADRQAMLDEVGRAVADLKPKPVGFFASLSRLVDDFAPPTGAQPTPEPGAGPTEPKPEAP